jgi:hypothetical protein
LQEFGGSKIEADEVVLASGAGKQNCQHFIATLLRPMEASMEKYSLKFYTPIQGYKVLFVQTTCFLTLDAVFYAVLSKKSIILGRLCSKTLTTKNAKIHAKGAKESTHKIKFDAVLFEYSN